MRRKERNRKRQKESREANHGKAFGWQSNKLEELGIEMFVCVRACDIERKGKEEKEMRGRLHRQYSRPQEALKVPSLSRGSACDRRGIKIPE